MGDAPSFETFFFIFKTFFFSSDFFSSSGGRFSFAATISKTSFYSSYSFFSVGFGGLLFNLVGSLIFVILLPLGDFDWLPCDR